MIGQYPIIRQYAFVGAVFTADHAMICQREGLFSATMKYAIYRPSCLTWIVTMCKLNRHYNLLQAKSLPEGLTKPLMHALTSTVGVSGSDRGLHFSI